LRGEEGYGDEPSIPERETFPGPDVGKEVVERELAKSLRRLGGRIFPEDPAVHITAAGHAGLLTGVPPGVK
jgi:hypothetical protein